MRVPGAYCKVPIVRDDVGTPGLANLDQKNVPYSVTVVSMSPPPRCLDRSDVDVFHLHHRLEGTLGLAATSRKRLH